MVTDTATPQQTLTLLEARVEAIERRVTDLRNRITIGGRTKDWRRTIGMFANDPVFDEIVRLGREWRESENEIDFPEDGAEK